MNAERDRLNALERQVAARRHALLDATRAADGVVDVQQWAELERLQQLLDLESASGPSRAAHRRTRAVQLALAGIVALAVLTLLLIRLPTARIGLQVQATHARMTIARETPLTPPFPVRWIVTEGHSAVNVALADGSDRALDAAVIRIETVANDDGANRAAARTPSRAPKPVNAGAPHMEVRLPPIPANAQVGFDAGFGDGSIALTLCGVEQPLAMNVIGGARISGGQSLTIAPGEAARIFVAPAAMRPTGADKPTGDRAPATNRQSNASALDPCSADHELRLRFQPAVDALDLQPDAFVRDIQLLKPTISSLGFFEPQSTVLGGRLQLLSVKVPPRTLEKHDLLELVGAVGRLRSAQVGPAAVSLDFDGEVHDLFTGSPYRPESMMPRLLQWFLSQELLLVAWSSGLTALGVALGLHRWLSSQS